VLLLDGFGRVLLLEHRVARDGLETVWAAPGGGCEPGENPAQAAARELAEECGIVVQVAEHAVHSERRAWQFDQVAYDQTDHFFVVRVAEQPTVRSDNRTELEEFTVLGYRWFSADELLAGAVRFEPAALVEVLNAALVNCASANSASASSEANSGAAR
jgi:8-oxo-dGTP pyrophosphatase MutT (NUDIX family)